MRIWQLEPRAGSLQVEPAMIADLLASITEPDSASLPRAILNLELHRRYWSELPSQIPVMRQLADAFATAAATAA